MGDRTKIDWCDASWNPVTGCLHGCEYCYARGIAERFAGSSYCVSTNQYEDKKHTKLIFADLWNGEAHFINGKVAPYPYGFTPTYHRERLNIPSRWTRPRTIFVCSMADLFGKWVPDAVIQDVMRACQKAPQHRYLFLTKNPDRYLELDKKGIFPRNFWYGYSATKNDDLWRFHHADECPCIHLFVSIEPMLEPMNPGFCSHVPADWVIIGAETGNRKGKVVPDKSWIMEIAEECELCGIPVFMKESLRGIMGEDFRQEFPWEREEKQEL